MEKRSLKSARLKTAAYDPDTRVLEIEFHGGELRRFKNVPAEVWRRLLAAPNPASFFEDRIEEEYPFERSRSQAGGNARSTLDSLFGSDDKKAS